MKDNKWVREIMGKNNGKIDQGQLSLKNLPALYRVSGRKKKAVDRERVMRKNYNKKSRQRVM